MGSSIQDGGKTKDGKKGKVSVKQGCGRGRTSRDIREVDFTVAMKTCFHGPIDDAKTLKLRFRVGDLGLPERRKRNIRVYQ